MTSLPLGLAVPAAGEVAGAATPTLTFDVHGQPAMQGSKKHVGRGIMVEASKRTKPWRDNVRATTAAAVACDDWERLDGPVEVRLLFCFDRPAGHYRTGRNATLLRDNAPLFPANRSSGDVDKMQRAIFDAVVDAGAIKDDAQIVRVRVAKVWAGEHEGALEIPGVRIEIRAVTS